MKGALVLFAVLLGGTACTDRGIVGSRAAASALCDPVCEGGERCHPELGMCVQCLADMDCASSSAGPLCDLGSNACRACVAGDECPVPECEEPDEPDDLFDDDCDLDEADGSIDDDDDDNDPSP